MKYETCGQSDCLVVVFGIMRGVVSVTLGGKRVYVLRHHAHINIYIQHIHSTDFARYTKKNETNNISNSNKIWCNSRPSNAPAMIAKSEAYPSRPKTTSRCAPAYTTPQNCGHARMSFGNVSACVSSVMAASVP